MPAKYFRTRGHLLLCGHANCRARGADLLHLALTKALEERRLMYYKTGGSVRLTTSGCLGACGYGPILACYRERNGALEEAWYENVGFRLALGVAEAVQNEDDLPDEQKYGP